MDEMDFITSKLDDIKHQIDAQSVLLGSKIRYGDRQVEALVTMAVDRHDRLQRDFDGLRSDFKTFKDHVESGELATANQKIAEDLATANQKITWNRQTVFAVIGWVVVIALAIVAYIK